MNIPLFLLEESGTRSDESEDDLLKLAGDRLDDFYNLETIFHSFSMENDFSSGGCFDSDDLFVDKFTLYFAVSRGIRVLNYTFNYRILYL